MEGDEPPHPPARRSSVPWTPQFTEALMQFRTGGLEAVLVPSLPEVRAGLGRVAAARP